MKKAITGFLAGVILTMSVSVAASVGIGNVRIARDTKLIVSGKQVNTDIVYGVKDGDKNGKNYVSAQDLARALGYDVGWDGKTKSITVFKDGKVGLNDPIDESGTTFKKLLNQSGYDIDNMYATGKFDDMKEFLDLLDLPDEVLALLIAEDYHEWLKDGDVLFGDFWNQNFKK